MGVCSAVSRRPRVFASPFPSRENPRLLFAVLRKLDELCTRPRRVAVTSPCAASVDRCAASVAADGAVRTTSEIVLVPAVNSSVSALDRVTELRGINHRFVVARLQVTGHASSLPRGAFPFYEHGIARNRYHTMTEVEVATRRVVSVGCLSSPTVPYPRPSRRERNCHTEWKFTTYIVIRLLVRI